MFGCVLFGGLAVMALAGCARRRHFRWMHAQHHFRHGHGHGHGFGGCGPGGHFARFGGFPGGCQDGLTGEFGGAFREGFRDGYGDSVGHSEYGGHEHDDEHGHEHGHGFAPMWSRGGRWFVLRRFLKQIETTPTQAKAIRTLVEEFGETAKPLRGEAKRSRVELAGALRRTSLDEVALGEMFARHDRALEDMRKGFVGMMAKIHDLLDDTQRERLATLVEKGPRGVRPTDPFGDAW